MKKVKVSDPMQTHNGRPNWKAHSVTQLQEAIVKNSSPKVKHTIRQELNRKLNALKA